MNWALRWLHLPPEANERAVKRAYAQRLRQHRPDTDPEGFQQLHEAYQAALAWVRAHPPAPDLGAADQDDAGAATIAEVVAVAAHAPPPTAPDRPAATTPRPALAPRPALPAGTPEPLPRSLPAPEHAAPTPRQRVAPQPSWSHPASTPPPLPFDAVRWAGEALECATRLAPEELRRWLQAQPPLWSLQHQRAASAALCTRILQTHTPLSRYNLATLAQFFGWDDVTADADAQRICMLQAKLHLAWEVQPHNLPALALRTLSAAGNRTRKAHQASVASAMTQLTRPFEWAQAVVAGTVPLRPRALRRWLGQLDGGRVDRLPPPIQPRQVAFWIAASDLGHLRAPRLAIGFLRCIALSLLLTLLTLAVTASEDATQAQHLAGAGLIGIWGGWLAWLGGSVLLRWQTDDEAAPTRVPAWLRLTTVPLLATLAVLSIHLADARVPGTLLAVVSLLLALARGIRRASFRFAFSGWHALLLLPLLKGIVLVIMLGELAAVLACLAWAWDAFAQRARLRWR